MTHCVRSVPPFLGLADLSVTRAWVSDRPSLKSCRRLSWPDETRLAFRFLLHFGLLVGFSLLVRLRRGFRWLYAEENASVGLSEVFESSICGRGDVESLLENFHR